MYPSKRLLVGVSLVLSALVLTTIPAQAQSIDFFRLYPVKFVCGYEQGDIPIASNDKPGKYEELKPGNYATVINILNATISEKTVYIYVARANDTLRFMTAISIPALQTRKIGCPHIARTIGESSGRAFEGMVELFATNDHFEVWSVLTYATLEAFERHRVYGFNDKDQTISPIRSEGSGPASLPGPVLAGSTDVAGSGAGGMGLGGSIDVEEVPPRLLNPIVSKDDVDRDASPPSLPPFGSAGGK